MDITERKKLKNGVYLVVDPSMEATLLLQKIETALRHPLSAIQIWDHFTPEMEIKPLIDKICQLCQVQHVPVIINNRWEYVAQFPLDGVHFDNTPINLNAIRKQIDRPIIVGLTGSNDLSQIHWAQKNQVDYISFCSIFISSTRNSCELIRFSTVEQARKIYSGSIFLSGGITPDNITQLKTLDYDGVAIVSGIMAADHPDQVIEQYRQKLSTII